MMKRILLFTLIGITLNSQSQHARIVVQHSNTVQVFNDLGSAITAALPNSEIYLSGGTFLLPTGFALSKTLYFVGAGISSDSTNCTGTTTISSTDGSTFMRLASAASGSTFTGIRFNMNGNTAAGLGISDVDQTVVSVTFTRCSFQQDVYVGIEDPSASSVAFIDCIFHRRVLGADGAQAQLTRCILDYQAGTGAEVSGFEGGGLIMVNCVGLGTRVGNAGGATITNCIFTRTTAPVWQSNGATITNNLLVSVDVTSNMSGSIESGNITNQNIGTIFANEADSDFQFSDDLQLQNTSPGVNAGIDGTDVGIYGTTSPFKPGAVPHVPHFQKIEAGTGTDANGDLRIQIQVAAQSN